MSTPFDPKQLLAPNKNHKADTAPSGYASAVQTLRHDPDEQFNPAQSYGKILDNHYNVEMRQEPCMKRRKIEQTDAEDDLVRVNKPEHGASRGSGGELGRHLKDKQKEMAKNGTTAHSNVIDLTEDDVVVVQDNMEKEVCAGRIEGARVNAHRIPAPKMAGFTGTQKTWPSLKVQLSRRPGTNTHIIGVSDPVNKDFGTIDVRTASVLAPLMDSVRTSKVRLTARLDPRQKKPFEFPGQNCSEHYAITIIIYAPRKMIAGIGKLFMQHQVFLRDPAMVERGVDLVNPHAPKDFTPKKAALASSSSRYIAGATVMRTQEETRNDVLKIFDSLQETDNLPEMEQPLAVKTPMLKHQRQALYFMTEREKDKRNDLEAKDETSLWQKEDRRGKASWYNVITGHSVPEEPEPVLGGILADVMGLGKTLNVLALVASTRREASEFMKRSPPVARYEDDAQELTMNNKATLLICPLSTVSNWEDQIKQHIKKGDNHRMNYMVYHGTNRTNDKLELIDWDIVITTYSVVAADGDKRSARRPNNPLAEINWFRIVLDEGHIIREQSTRQSKTVCALASERRWAVTGTPVQNRLEDLGALIKFLKIRPFDEARNFNQYIIAPFKTADVEILPKLRLLVDSITLRRLKDKIDLPKRIEEIVRLEMSDGERSFYDFFSRESTKNVRTMLQQEKVGGRGYAHILKAILRLRLMCAAGSDLLSDEDWDAARGFNINTAIDLEDEDNDKPDRTPRAAFELYKMMTDTNNNFCAECQTFVKAREVLEAEEDDDEKTPDTFGFIAGCNQLICPRCIEDFRKRCNSVAGPDHFGNCPSCDTYMRMTFFELRQAEFDAEELAQREIRANPRLAKQAGRYSGPHTKTQALVAALQEDAVTSANFEPGVPPLKSVVFSGWTNHLDLIQLALTNSEINYVRLDGSMTRKARRAALDAFANDDDITCILVSIAAGGLGLNLTAASRVFVMEPQYNPAQEDQAVERVHRLGQKREVRIVKYIMDDSFEEKMLLLQKKKKALADISIEKGKQGLGTMDQAKKRMEDLRTLFK